MARTVKARLELLGDVAVAAYYRLEDAKENVQYRRNRGENVYTRRSQGVWWVFQPARAISEQREGETMSHIINHGSWLQACVSTGAVGIRTAAAVLRREGYLVKTSSIGNQVTDVGLIKMTLVNVAPGTHPDTFDAEPILRFHIPELR